MPWRVVRLALLLRLKVTPLMTWIAAAKSHGGQSHSVGQRPGRLQAAQLMAAFQSRCLPENWFLAALHLL